MPKREAHRGSGRLARRGRAAALLAALALASAAASGAPPAAIAAKTLDNIATGTPGGWDFGGTDLTSKETLGELWIVDAYAAPPAIHAFSLADLRLPPRRLRLQLPQELTAAPVLGIAEVPHGARRGRNLVLVDPAFGEAGEPRPHLGFLDDGGAPADGETFAPVTRLGVPSQLASIDVHPEREEIVAYDLSHHAAVFLDFSFAATREPLPLLGFPSFFGSGPWFFGRGDVRGAGMGIAYDGGDALLAVAGLVNAFESRFVLRYDLGAPGGYSGLAVDLGLPAAPPLGRDLAFIGIDTFQGGPGEELLLAHNFGDDSLYSFRLERAEHAEPVSDLTCGVDPDTGAVVLRWRPPAGPADSLRVLENGVEVASLPPDAGTYTTPGPLAGKAFFEVAAESGGEVSLLRPLCQAENSRRPALSGVEADTVQIDNLGPLAGVAVTALPGSPEEFRGYAVGLDSNSVSVFNHKLEVLETLPLDPPIYAVGTNIAVVGVAIVRLDGEDLLAILDSDGPGNNNVPSAGFYALGNGRRGKLVRQVDPIDLTNLEPRPFLHDWDAGADGNLVAGGRLPDGRFVLVRILFDGQALAATQMAPLPHSLLSPAVGPGPTGIGVSILPSGNLLVAGSDAFSRTYTEALLVTPFCDSGPAACRDGGVHLAGYAQGLLATNQFLPGVGPLLGPSSIIGLDTAYFPPTAGAGGQGIGVTYLPTGDTIVLRNPSLPASAAAALRFGPSNLLIHCQNDCSHPELMAASLLDETYSLPARGEARTPAVAAAFADATTTDYYIHLVNASTGVTAEVDLEVVLGGLPAAPAATGLAIPPGRYHRLALLATTAPTVALVVRSRAAGAVDVRLLVGAKALPGGEPPPEPRFRRGDCDADGSLSLTDALVGLNWLFLSGPAPPCLDACDTEDGGTVGLTSMVALLNHLFLGGRAPPAPGPLACGADPTSGDPLARCAYPEAACR